MIDPLKSLDELQAKLDAAAYLLLKSRIALRDTGHPADRKLPAIAYEWATQIQARQATAPTYVERLVAEAILETDARLNDAATNITRDLERAFVECDGLARMLAETIYSNEEKDVAKQRAGAKTHRFKDSRNRHRYSFVLSDEDDLYRFMKHYREYITKHTANGLNMSIADVFACDGTTVSSILKMFADTLSSPKSKHPEISNIAVRVILQNHHPKVESDIISTLESPLVDFNELKSRNINIWIRRSPESEGHARRGQLYGNWISSARISPNDPDKTISKLWRGSELDSWQTHDFFFGIHGGYDQPKIYNHFRMGSKNTSAAMRKTHSRWAAEHSRLWKETNPPDDNPTSPIHHLLS